MFDGEMETRMTRILDEDMVMCEKKKKKKKMWHIMLNKVTWCETV